MDDDSVLAHIGDLVAEEKRLRASGHQLTGDDRQRLDRLQHELDRTWDLLRQRRAHEEFGEDPDAATERSENEVDRYLQ